MNSLLEHSKMRKLTFEEGFSGDIPRPPYSGLPFEGVYNTYVNVEMEIFPFEGEFRRSRDGGCKTKAPNMKRSFYSLNDKPTTLMLSVIVLHYNAF